MNGQEYITLLESGEIFIDYGPVSMVVSAKRDGFKDSAFAKTAIDVVEECLKELGRDLQVLKKYPGEIEEKTLQGLSLDMYRAVAGTGCPTLTPMAAVAGAVSDKVADYLFAKGAQKVFANNGGDIALRMKAGEGIHIGLVQDLSDGAGVKRRVYIDANMQVGGVATSGLGGRSFTRGIADSVTVFAPNGMSADATATLLANCSYLPLPAVHRVKAGELAPDSDIANLEITVSVGTLTESEKEQALEQVLQEAKEQYRRKNLLACIASVQGKSAVFDPLKLFE